MSKSYRDLNIYRQAYELALEIHKMSMKLPKYELYEEGSQIRRSSKSIPANIAEGYGRRRYKNEFLKYLIYAIASCDETRVHLDFLHDAKHVEKAAYDHLVNEYKSLGRMLNNFINAVMKGHRTGNADDAGC